MKNIEERFRYLVEEDENHPEYWMEEARLQILVELEDAMEREGINKKDLADRLGVSQAYVSKLFHSDVNNFTLKTIVQLSMAVGLKPSIHLEKMDLVNKRSADSWSNTSRQVSQRVDSIQSTWLKESRKSNQLKNKETHSCPIRQQEEANENTDTSNMHGRDPIAA